jgi:hypothetical protein
MKKMKNLILSTFIVSAFSTVVFGQDSSAVKKGYKYNNDFDFALMGSDQFALALSWSKFHSITKKKRFKIGYGVRFTSQFGSDLAYNTAPAKLTSGKTGLGVLFSENIPANIDTFQVGKSQNNALNISINLQYTFKNKFDLGFNIDAIGFSFGGKTSGVYSSYTSPLNGSTQSASPTSFNALLTSDSELYFRYWFKPNWAVRIGASFLFTEYTTENKLRLDNDRFRNKTLMGLIGVTYSPFR